MANGEPLAKAGLWRSWKEVDGSHTLAFTMLTVNSSEHPLMNRFHKLGDEKRSVVIVSPADYEGWLTSRSMDEAQSFLNLYPAKGMHAEVFPAPPRATSKKSAPPAAA